MPPPPKYVARPKGKDLQTWWKDNHVIQSYKRPVSALSSRPSTAATTRQTPAQQSRPSTAMQRSAPAPKLAARLNQSRVTNGSTLTLSVINDAKAAAIRFAHPTMKAAFDTLGRTKYIDEFLLRTYEYINIYLVYHASSESAIQVDESTVLATQQALALFSAAYYKLLLEASRQGEKDLILPASECKWQQYLFKLTDAAMTHKFDEVSHVQVHTELARILPEANFTLGAAASLSQTYKYEQALLKLGGLTSAQRVAPLAEAVRTAVVDILPADVCNFFLVDEETGDIWDERKGGDDGVGTTRFHVGTGIAGACAQSCQTIQVDEDVSRDERYHPNVDAFMHRLKPRFTASTPVISSHGGCAGVIQVARMARDARPFDSHDMIFLEGFAAKVADAVEGAMWRKAHEQKSLHMQFQLALSESGVKSKTISEWATGVATCCKDFFDVTACSVLVEQDNTLRRVGCVGVKGLAGVEPPPLTSNDTGGQFPGFCGHALSLGVGRLGVSNDVSASGMFDQEVDHERGLIQSGDDPSDQLWKVVLPVTTVLCLPLVANGRGVGVVKLMNKVDALFGINDEKLALGSQALLSSQLEHVKGFETAVDNQRQDHEMLELACELMGGTDLSSLTERVMTLCGERLKCSEFSLVMAERRPVGGDPERPACYNRLSMNSDKEIRTTHVATAYEHRKAKGIKKKSKHEEDGLIGIAGHVFRSRALHNVQDPFKDPYFDPKVDRPERIETISSILSVPIHPIISEPKPPVAVLQVFNKDPHGPARGFGRLDEQFLRALSPVLCTALDNVWRHSEAVQTSRDACKLLNAVGQVLESSTITALVEQVREVIPPVLDCQRAVLLLYDDTKNKLALLPGTSADGEESAGLQIDLGGSESVIGIAGHTFKQRRVLSIVNPEMDERWCDAVDSSLGYTPRGVLSVPVAFTPKAEGWGEKPEPVIVGVLQAVNKIGNPGVFRESDELLLSEVAGFIASAVQKLMTQERDTQALAVNDAVGEHGFQVLTELQRNDLNAAIAAMKSVVECEHVHLFLWDPASEALRPVKEVLNPEAEMKHGIYLGQGLIGRCGAECITHISPLCDADDAYNPNSDPVKGVHMHNMMVAPIRRPDEDDSGDEGLVGVVRLGNKRLGDGFDDFDKQYVEAFCATILPAAIVNLKRLFAPDEEK